jgi:hypothetical protein
LKTRRVTRALGALGLSTLLAGGILATTAPKAEAVSIYVHHEPFSARSSLHCKDANGHVYLDRGKAAWILKRPPRYCWVPGGYVMTWNPIGPGIFGYSGGSGRGRWVNVPWAPVATEVWFKAS